MTLGSPKYGSVASFIIVGEIRFGCALAQAAAYD
jgi:hypothetical protein